MELEVVCRVMVSSKLCQPQTWTQSQITAFTPRQVIQCISQIWREIHWERAVRLMSTSNDRLRLIWRFRSFNTGVEQPPGTNVIGITTNNLGAPNDLKAIQPTSLILPVEIWLSILEHSDSARDKLKAITALSKLFRLTFFPMFRRIAHLDISRVPSSSIGIPNEHRRLVLDLTIACSNRLTGMEFSTAVAAHFLSFNEFSNLVSFNWAVSRPLPGGMYLILRSSPVLRSLMISSGPQRISSTSGFLDLAPPRCQLTTAGVGKAHVVGDIFRPGAPSRSSITTLVVFHSKLIYCLSPTLTLSSLVILDIRCTLKYSSVSALFHLLSSTPTLEHLSLCEGSPYCDIDSSTRDATACPFLKSVTDLAWIPSVFMPLLYGKRTLERLELVGPLLAADVKRIHWQSLRVVDITFSHPDVEGKLVEVIEGGGTVNWTDVTFRANDWRPATSHDDVSTTLITFPLPAQYQVS